MTGEGGWEDRSDVSCPARPSAQELRELSSRRACTLTRLALTVVGCGGPLESGDRQLPSYQRPSVYPQLFVASSWPHPCFLGARDHRLKLVRMGIRFPHKLGPLPPSLSFSRLRASAAGPLNGCFFSR